MWEKLDPQIGLLQRGLDVSHFRHEILSNNIANADTPNFKRQDINFEQAMRQAMGKEEELGLNRSHPRHFDPRAHFNQLQAETVEGTRTRQDGNNVDVEVEMAKMAGNGLYFQTSSQMISNRFSMLERIINSGRP